MRVDNADTRIVLLAMGIFDTGDTCECCMEHSLYIDAYVHNGRVRKYCPVCAQVFDINQQDIMPTMALIENIVPLPSAISEAVM